MCVFYTCGTHYHYTYGPNDRPTNPPENLPDPDAELDPEEIDLPNEEPQIPKTNINASSTQRPKPHPDTRKINPMNHNRVNAMQNLRYHNKYLENKKKVRNDKSQKDQGSPLDDSQSIMHVQSQAQSGPRNKNRFQNKL